ncbi:hypothetical protein [Levilactobacillus acidifarinae]|uniref:Surface layer protein slpc n=1 Tax=Levilactobacillus acidifarinae DSM 19394 = JCM 15949 TaxID=1423715 RepID=A0A0R1LFG8_9LACO|nr:hypothetical protein [Levilactobacillus acidifarinae]KRK94587.1 surface layer protein slpc [Levilactobacillus acidifarinae DSM 19394]GEO68339.1 hypothetical protein LAC03_02490 [Levilactobacillus acidifarinae]
MQSRLAKSLYLGLAALSFGAVASVSTTASAKSKAYVVSNTTMTSDPTTRNVALTGSNAIYTKPGTAAGARVVASKYTAGNLANSKNSAYYFRAYRIVKTNRGSIYYKVVSMSGQYRGYIYGGKTANEYAGGVQAANTMTDAKLPATTTATFANPGTKNVTWAAPKYAQYKSTKMVKSTVPYAKDTLKITKAATKTREGWLYYYVEDAQNPNVNGWIYADALKIADANTIDAKDGITLNFVDKATGSAISSKVVAMPKGTTNSVTNYQAIQLANANIPAGYTYSLMGSSSTVAKGGSIVVYLIKNPTKLMNMTAKVYNADAPADAQTVLTSAWNSTANQDALKKDDFFSPTEGAIVKGTDIDAHLAKANLKEFVVKTVPTADNLGSVAYQFKLETPVDTVASSKTTTSIFYSATKGTVKASVNNGAFVPDAK